MIYCLFIGCHQEIIRSRIDFDEFGRFMLLMCPLRLSPRMNELQIIGYFDSSKQNTFSGNAFALIK